MNNKVTLNLRSSTGVVTIDLAGPPDNLEELISRCFADYTEETPEDCIDLDRLCYIDLIRKRIYNKPFYEYRGEMAHRKLDYALDYDGNFDLEDDIDSSLDFAEQAYNDGFMPLYFTRHGLNTLDTIAVRKTLVRIIKTVMEWRRKKNED